MAPPTHLGYVVQVLVAWVACWCLRAIRALPGLAQRLCEPGQEMGKHTQVRAFALLLRGSRAPSARFGRAVFSPGTEPDYEIQPLGKDVITSPDEAAPTEVPLRKQ